MKGKIFNAQEVQAILDGSKVMFREVIKAQPPHDFKTIEKVKVTLQNLHNAFCVSGENYDFWFGKSPYEVGQKIFVKEDFFGCPIYHKDAIFSARYMKQEHSRLTLLIKEIRVERLESISEEDARKEGVEGELVPPDGGSWPYYEGFRTFWNATHKKPEEKFEASPFVWVISFEVVK